jgi:hypothetical protein
LNLWRAGLAAYDAGPQTTFAYGTFLLYYIWMLLDMVPGLKLTELLTLTAPLKLQNSIAGIPVVVFRAFILFGLFVAGKKWWQGRQVSSPSPGQAATAKTH